MDPISNQVTNNQKHIKTHTLAEQKNDATNDAFCEHPAALA